ncbi:MAG: hypothetical protein GX986_12260 [Firmicutes bacterium]|nr:hypothetical protein [Bacillota bacterium]
MKSRGYRYSLDIRPCLGDSCLVCDTSIVGSLVNGDLWLEQRLGEVSLQKR